MNFVKIKKKQSMTLVALLVTMSVTCILLGMFIPLFVQGMVNIASGKSFDGSVNLNRRNGYFLCYYDNDGRLTQTRADVAPNGKDVEVITALAAGNKCLFDIPSWPDSFKVTLIGGGGAGAIGDFSLVDETVEGIEEKVITPTVSGDSVTYNFDTDSTNSAMVESFLNENAICLAKGKAVRVENGVGCADPSNACSLTIDTKNKTVSYNIAGKLSSAGISGANILTDGDLGVINVLGCTDKPKMYKRLATGGSAFFSLGNKVTLRTKRVGLSLDVPKGGELGQKVERMVPYFTSNGNQLSIPAANLGAGGVSGVKSGMGGNTTLNLPGGAVVIANGGNAGAVEENLYYDEGGNVISAKEFAGENGNIDRFIPAPLKITDLRRGNGANDTSVNGGSATYSGAGGGAGAISLSALNMSVVADPCLEKRTQMSVSGRAYEIDCSPIKKTDVFSIMTRSNSGKGAPGAILIAW